MKGFIISSLLVTLSVSAYGYEIHTPHCLGACPSGVPETNDLIVRDIYTISSNDQTKFADWAAYKVTKDTIGSGCNRKWKADPKLSDPETLEPRDYKGAHKAIGIDRGHQVPLASICGTSSWYQANYLSNITPQKSELNQGPWRLLEEAVRKLAKEGDTVYVLTGPLYEREMPSLPNTDEPHRIPSGYWKVVAIKKNSEVFTASFVFDQNTSRTALFCDHLRSVEEIEHLSGLSLFGNIPVISRKIAAELCTQ